MAIVEAVRGEIDSRDLGFTLMHEHIFVLSPEIQQNSHTEFGDEAARIAAAISRLNQLSAAGVNTLVDLTVIGQGRYIPRIEAIAREVSINIIVATGLYTYNEVPFYFQNRGPKTLIGGEEPLVELFVRDIREGIADTGVRAGILKCATDSPGVTAGVERVLRAVAVAHRQTGVPISTHSFAMGRTGLEQLRIFDEEGVDPSRVIIGHSGDTNDVGYLRELADRGCYLGMDRFGFDLRLPFEERVATVTKMCELGYSANLVLSQDAACHNDWLDDAVVASLMPRWDYFHLSNDVIPELRRRGVTQGQIDEMTIDNPRRIFEANTSY